MFRVYKKNYSFICFHSLIYHSKIHKCRRIFFERGGNSLKRTYVEGVGVHLKQTWTLEVSSEHTRLMTPNHFFI